MVPAKYHEFTKHICRNIIFDNRIPKKANSKNKFWNHKTKPAYEFVSMDKLKIVILFNKLIFSKMQTIHSPAMYETLVSHI
jgi:hypothetical protein